MVKVVLLKIDFLDNVLKFGQWRWPPYATRFSADIPVPNSQGSSTLTRSLSQYFRVALLLTRLKFLLWYTHFSTFCPWYSSYTFLFASPILAPDVSISCFLPVPYWQMLLLYYISSSSQHFINKVIRRYRPDLFFKLSSVHFPGLESSMTSDNFS